MNDNLVAYFVYVFWLYLKASKLCYKWFIHSTFLSLAWAARQKTNKYLSILCFITLFFSRAERRVIFCSYISHNNIPEEVVYLGRFYFNHTNLPWYKESWATHGLWTCRECSLAISPVNTLLGSMSPGGWVTRRNCRTSSSSPVLSMPNFSHTAGQNLSFHVMKSSSMLQQSDLLIVNLY